MTEQERNTAVVIQLTEAMNRGDTEAALSLLAPDATNHGRPVGREGFARTIRDIRTRFPDSRFEIASLAAVDNHVIVRGMASGTHLGTGTMPFIDGGLLLGVPPTGKRYSVQHIHWWTLRDGLVVEHWANRDDVEMMVQLGLLTRPTPSG